MKKFLRLNKAGCLRFFYSLINKKDNLELICSFENMNGIPNNPSSRRYERDFLLQLRLHPFSLQKPKSLKDLEIIKDKLYLHQVDSTCGANAPNVLPVYQGTMKPDSMFRSSRNFPNYYPRSGQPYSSSYKPYSGYYGVPTKSHSYHAPYSMNSVRKFPVATSADYKFNLLDDIFSPDWPTGSQTAPPFSKTSTYEDMWNYYSRSTQNNGTRDADVPTKSKKTLPIIDPSNGKNILEGIIKTSPTSTSQESIGESGSDPLEPLSSADEEKTEGKDALKTQINGYAAEDMESGQEIQDSNMISSENEAKKAFEEIPGENNVEMKDGIEKTSETSLIDYPSQQQMNDFEKEMCYNSLEDQFTTNNKNSDKEQCSKFSTLRNSRTNGSFSSRDFAHRTDEQLKVDIALLKEKMYAMNQEMQKMAAYESFLRFKKHQVDEFFANWKRYFISKENRLKEKESWLEHKKNDLKNKEQELHEREKKLNAVSFEFQLNGGCLAEPTEEIHENSDETPNSLSGSKLFKYVNAGRKLAEGAEEFGASRMNGDIVIDGNLDKDVGEGNEMSAFPKAVGSKTVQNQRSILTKPYDIEKTPKI